MKGPSMLAQSAGKVSSRVGGCSVGSHAIFRGQDLHRDLKDMDWLELHVFGITGRRPTREQLRMLHAIWVYTSYPDARIWNNRVAALSGTTRSTGSLGMAAAVAVSEARIYGTGPGLGAYDFFVAALAGLARGEDLMSQVRAELKANRGIGGYGRPIAAHDERIEPLMQLAHELGLGEGVHVQLAFQVDALLRQGRWRLKINYAALVAALLLDLGFSRQEFSVFVAHLFLAGMAPCFIDAAERPEGTLLPLSCNDIRYEGPARRSWSTRGPQATSATTHSPMAAHPAL